MNLAQSKKILIIRLSSLGDVLLTTPVIRSIKKHHQHISIDYLVRENFADAVKLNPNLENVIFYDDSDAFIEKLRNNEYDLVVDLHNNFRSKKIRRNLGVSYYKFVKPSIEKFLLVHFKMNKLRPIKSIPERYAASIPNLELDENGPELHIPELVSTELNQQKETIGLCPGAVHYTKRWPLENFVDLGIRLTKKGYRIVLLGGTSDKEFCEKLSEMIPVAQDLSNNNNLFQTAAAIRECKLVVCNDSGLMHTSTALNVPVISIFGSTVEEFGFFPYKSKSTVIENSNLNCRPCTHIGRSKCPKKHFKCMFDLSSELVYNETVKFMDNL